MAYSNNQHSKQGKKKPAVLTCCLGLSLAAVELGSSGCKSANTLLMGHMELAPSTVGVYLPLSYL
jgi:hypothetical protein